MMSGDPKLSNTHFKLPGKQSIFHINSYWKKRGAFICVIFKKPFVYSVIAASVLEQNTLNRINFFLKTGFTVATISPLAV